MAGDVVSDESVLPEEPVLAEAVTAFAQSKQLGLIVDTDWQVVYRSEDLGRNQGWTPPLHVPFLGTEWCDAQSPRVVESFYGDQHASNAARAWLGVMLADLGRARVEATVHPDYLDTVDSLEPIRLTSMLSVTNRLRGFDGGHREEVGTATRVRDERGRLVGTVIETKPNVSTGIFGWLVSFSDPDHLERTRRVTAAARRPAAVLFADLEASAPLARRLPTATYFSLARRLVRATDKCVIDTGGLVGRHVGDGVAAFFLAEDAGSESAAAHACVTTARAIQRALPDIARRCDLEPDDIVMRMGLHWASTLYVGSIISTGRSEVTALGTEVNQAARIEACATGGRILASKDLIERLDPDDAAALDLDPAKAAYTALGDLPHATAKARRDAPVISVCEA